MTQSKRYHIYEYELPSGWRVLAGKTDADNDFLTLKVAKPNDYWFHVRGMPGSHVVLRAKPSEDPDLETLYAFGCRRRLSQQGTKGRHRGRLMHKGPIHNQAPGH